MRTKYPTTPLVSPNPAQSTHVLLLVEYLLRQGRCQVLHSPTIIQELDMVETLKSPLALGA